jgi:hypothetical protein
MTLSVCWLTLDFLDFQCLRSSCKTCSSMFPLMPRTALWSLMKKKRGRDSWFAPSSITLFTCSNTAFRYGCSGPRSVSRICSLRHTFFRNKPLSTRQKSCTEFWGHRCPRWLWKSTSGPMNLLLQPDFVCVCIAYWLDTLGSHKRSTSSILSTFVGSSQDSWRRARIRTRKV